MDFRSITELREALDSRELSAVELLELTARNVEATQTALNAVVVTDFDRARDAAEKADLSLKRGSTAPLLGIPMTIKEAIDIRHMPTTWGIPQFANHFAAQDAAVVSNLKRAGAVIYGKTNVSTWLADWQTTNPIYDRTNNPWI